MICAKIKPAVSGLDAEFPGRVKGTNVDAMTPEGKEAVAALGFKNHGLAVRDASGKVVFSQPDHTVDMDQVRKKLKELTAK